VDRRRRPCLGGGRALSRFAPLLLVLAACAADPTPSGWQVAGGFLRDPDGRAVILRGVNLSGTHKRAPYLDYHGPEDFRRIRDDWGMNAVRFLVTWAAVAPRPGEIDVAYLDAVAERMAWAEAAGLLVVVDMHQDLFGEGFAGGDGAPRWACDEARYAAFTPRTPWFLGYLDANVAACFDALWGDARLDEAWRAVARRLAASPAVIGYDALNEPHWGSANLHEFEAARLDPFYRRVGAAIAEEAPAWIPFREPSAARNLGLGITTRLAPFTGVYAPHAYDGEAESGIGFDEARRQAYLDNVAALAAEARALGAALVLGEYGGVAARPGIVEYMDAAYDAAGEAAAGSFYWHHGRDEGYGLLHADGSEKTELIDVLARPYPERVAGDPVRYGLDGDRFTLVYRSDAAIAAPTVISLPVRFYRSGVRVTCEGCTVELAPGAARIRAPSGLVTVVVDPI
jgi:endoglycosylceramidase